MELMQDLSLVWDGEWDDDDIPVTVDWDMDVEDYEDFFEPFACNCWMCIEDEDEDNPRLMRPENFTVVPEEVCYLAAAESVKARASDIFVDKLEFYVP